MPQWAGSCWYYLRFCDPTNDKAAWDPKMNSTGCQSICILVVQNTPTSHLLYSRFWHKVLFDCGLVGHNEAFTALRNQGLVVARSFKDKHGKYISSDEVVEDQGVYLHTKSREVLTSQIEKMSKSKLNGVPPDELIGEYGADAFRLAVTFIGPLEKEKVWNSDVLIGCRRFLTKSYDMFTSSSVTDIEDEESLRLAHRLVAKAKEDIEALQFNTVIAKMMEFINSLSSKRVFSKQQWSTSSKFSLSLLLTLGKSCGSIWAIKGL